MICKDCDMTFDEPDLIRDTDDAYGTRISYVTDTVCPHCGSSNIAESATCMECGAEYPDGADCMRQTEKDEKEAEKAHAKAVLSGNAEGTV